MENFFITEKLLINIKATTIVKRIISISPKIISCWLKNIKFHIKFKKYCINKIDINFGEFIRVESFAK